ncbi:MAG TPA: hypothetical protein VM327_06880 [Candidatus Thermoplasmatota archaeon]|nr:hypothetical protein [Candidatus Thermoplasmatota archaeon]
MRTTFAVLALLTLSGGLLPSTAAQETTILPEPFELTDCDIPAPLLFAHIDGVGFENLVFDGQGSMYLTAFEHGLYRAFPNGTVLHVASDDRPIPPDEGVGENGPNNFMSPDIGPDGALYVSEGMAIQSPVSARILRFPVPGEPEFEVYADGFDGANGLAWGSDGNLYLAHGFRTELWQVTGKDTYRVYGNYPTVNGVVAMPDGRLGIAQFGDPGQAVSAIDLERGDIQVLFHFNPGVSVAGNQPTVAAGVGPLQLKGIDDFVVLDDGRIVATAHFRLQFLLGDPATGDECILLSGAKAEPTSARVAKGFGAWDGWVFLVDNGGDVHAVDLRAGATGEAPGLPEAGEDVPEAAGTDIAAPGWQIVPLAGALFAAALLRRRGPA